MTTTIFIWVVIVLLVLIFHRIYLIGTYLVGMKYELIWIRNNLIESNEQQGWTSYPTEDQI